MLALTVHYLHNYPLPGSSPTAEAILKTGQKPLTSQSTVRPKQQLSYLADVLGFQVQFTDFPKVTFLLIFETNFEKSFL